uniref:FLYWCH-type domain-containing protein n=1 Tax=Glossina austeni TaxID=7395 RepID=A0A1A9VHZ3_GLOAU
MNLLGIKGNVHKNSRDFLLARPFIHNTRHGQYTGTEPKIQFSVSKRGGQLLWLDGLKYFRNNENRSNLFWRCHWYYRRIRCPVLICMNKYDVNDFRQIHKHCHIKSSKKQPQQKQYHRPQDIEKLNKNATTIITEEDHVIIMEEEEDIAVDEEGEEEEEEEVKVKNDRQ